MFSQLAMIFRIPELRQKILLTLVLLGRLSHGRFDPLAIHRSDETG